MGVGIEIAKVKEKNGIGYYEVSTNNYGGGHFYIGIDKEGQRIYFYESLESQILLGEIDCKDRDKPIRSFANIHSVLLLRVTFQAMKSFAMDDFPEYLSYVA